MSTAAADLARRLLDSASGDSPQPAVLQAVLQVLTTNPGEALTEGILTGISTVLDRPLVRDAAWETWGAGRHTGLGVLLIQSGHPAGPASPAAVLSRLALSQLSGLGENPEHIEALLAACTDPDAQIALRADSLLRSLTLPASRSELCRWVIQYDHPRARDIALACGYVPLDAPNRALFFLLTEQFERYQALDFDAGLLEAIYAAGSETLRSQIAALARQTGLAGFARIMTGSRLRRISSNLSDYEWEAVLVILNREQRFGDLWRLAQNAPPLWSARMLHSLHASGWQDPDPAEHSDFNRLYQAAAICPVELPAAMQNQAFVQHHATLHGHSRQITALAYLPAHQLLASASAEKAVRLWNLSTDRQLSILEAPAGHTDFVLSLAASPDGSWLASGGADRAVRIWSMPDGRLVQVLGGHAGRVSHLAASPDGQLLISGDERTLHVWHAAQNFRPLAVIKNQINGLNQLIFRPPANSHAGFIIAGDNDRTVRIWSLPTPENPSIELRRTLLTPVVGWALSPLEDDQGVLLASSSSYGAIQLWSIPEGEAVRSLPGRANNTLVAFSPDGRWLAIAASQSGRSGALLWNLAPERTGQPLFLPCGAGLTSALDFHPSSRLLAIASQDRSLRLWSILPAADPPTPLKILEGHNTPVRRLLYTPAGDFLVSADELTIHRWAIDLLSSLLATPAAQLQPNQLRTLLTDPDLDPAPRAWISFSLELAQRQRRFDIELDDVEILSIGEYDIELD